MSVIVDMIEVSVMDVVRVIRQVASDAGYDAVTDISPSLVLRDWVEERASEEPSLLAEAERAKGTEEQNRYWRFDNGVRLDVVVDIGVRRVGFVVAAGVSEGFRKDAVVASRVGLDEVFVVGVVGEDELVGRLNDVFGVNQVGLDRWLA